MSERLLWKSDAYQMVLCAQCGRGTCHDAVACSHCRNPTDAVNLLVPYSFKLLLQEMNAMGIDWQGSVNVVEQKKK